ncbi:thioredoxin [Aquaticitalea lipolytica]|jgi:thioredoxin-related protein|uniref:Thioredoxin n=1 Tax=Aquaticitalea lipolytica TaxID=1247562 RepID=A0A8J2XF12_9FLAO|nr:thioredoxin fold domain-containing protein [Aquaticitalea lipolytica]GFZ80939.1 thioredoxin [Aquaticitalea lipolytica]
MKKLAVVFALALFVSANSIAQEIKWVTFEEALALQKKKPKKIMMDVYTNWCGPCKMLDKNTFHNPDVVKYVNENYYAVKFNAEGNDVVKYKDKTYSNPNYKAELASRRNSVHDLTRVLKVNAYPTIVFFDEKGETIFPVRGYQNPQQLELYLKMFKDDKHKDMKKQEDFNAYYSAFVPAFKG